MRIRLRIVIPVICMIICLVTGCADVSGTKVVLTTGLGEDEVFRIESVSCSKPEMMVYITNMQNQYENVYGEQIWENESDGVTLEERVKENALAKMAQVKTMNLMAEKLGVELSSSEIRSAEKTAEIYFDSLNSTEIEAMGITEDTIVSLYREYMCAQKVYREIIKDVNPEISDDEARNITIEYILVNTYTTDGTGKRIEMTGDDIKAAYKRADEARDLAVAGEDFDMLVARYSDSDKMTMSIGKGDVSGDRVRNVLFNLSTDEISDVLEVEDGYMVAKCLSTYDLEETDLNKITLVEKQRETIFGEEYDEFVNDLTRKLNDRLWDEIGFLHDDEITTSDFFKVADENLVLDEE